MTDYSPDFEEFWKAYPKRNGQKVGKKPAFKVWATMKEGEKLLARQDVLKRNRQHGWGKYIRDGQRYLKHEGWNDEWEPYRPEHDDDSGRPTRPRHRQNVPNVVDRLCAAMARQQLCEHQRWRPWSYFGNVETGEVRGVTVRQCKTCGSSSKRVMAQELGRYEQDD